MSREDDEIIKEVLKEGFKLKLDEESEYFQHFFNETKEVYNKIQQSKYLQGTGHSKEKKARFSVKLVCDKNSCGLNTRFKAGKGGMRVLRELRKKMDIERPTDMEIILLHQIKLLKKLPFEFYDLRVWRINRKPNWEQIKKNSMKILRVLKKLDENFLQSQNPKIITVAVIYLSTFNELELKNRITVKSLSRAFNFTEVTIHNHETRIRRQYGKELGLVIR